MSNLISDRFKISFHQYQHNGDGFIYDENGERAPFVDERGRRVTRCYIYRVLNGKVDYENVVGFGESYCSPEDQHCRKVGNGVAFSRALGSISPQSFGRCSMYTSHIERIREEIKELYQNR